ncbi:MAG TPA: hypothetical protein VLY23_14670, partial [Candidatus Acidoferrum sp.]|nr:hypothetical protein [Candidatus Acidoferrum sp.]
LQDQHVECVAQQIAGFGLFLSHGKGSLPIRFLGEYCAVDFPFQAYFFAGVANFAGRRKFTRS